MSLTLTSLAGSLLLLGWQGQSGITYTIQSSIDCLSWESLPFVLEGMEGLMTYSFDAGNHKKFLRVRFSDNGDTNDNGLPDIWELSHFNRVDVDPNADPDGDKLTNFTEWLGGSDPNDFYNGTSPMLLSGCGEAWLVRENAVSSQSLSLYLTKPSGEPWANAPVSITVNTHRPALLQGTSDTTAGFHEMIAYTDQRGRISPQLHGIHILGAAEAPAREVLSMEAGQARLDIHVQTVSAGFTAPPRNVKMTSIDDSSGLLEWTGDPGNSLSFSAEKKTPQNDWVQIVRIPSADLAGIRTENGAYALTFSVNPTP